MSLDMNDDILKDFIIEAGEILDLLSEQLVDLESSPTDTELLNAIFRGFHTVKGGAGFLALHNLVEICHVAENVFDLLRQNKRQINAVLMDVVLKTLDAVNEMFVLVRQGIEPAPAPQHVMEMLATIIAEPVTATSVSLDVESPLEVVAEPAEVVSENIEILEDNNELSKQDIIENAMQGSIEIKEEEFEDLLDKLDGLKKLDKSFEDYPNINTKISKQDIIEKAKLGDEDITEEEFDNLLDALEDCFLPLNNLEQIGNSRKEQSDLLSKTNSASNDAVTAQVDALEPAKSVAIAKPLGDHNNNVKKISNNIKSADAPAIQGLADNRNNSSALSEATVRVDTSRLDQIMNMVGELVLVRNRLVKLKNKTTDDNIAKAVSNLDVVTADLQMAIMKTRMQPIKKVFGRFPRVVRDLARSLNKEIRLEIQGEDTDLDKNLVEALSDPLVHLVRNAVDHGIELPIEREQIGKPPEGHILLSAEQAGEHILLSICDDGKGMDAEKLRELAIEKGLMDAEVASRLDENDCYNLIFMPGFSTKQEISDISGRGVGMDVVKTKITQLNGTLHVDSKKGYGSTIKIKVPLTLAILPTLMIIVGKQTFALPLSGVNEIFNLDLKKTNKVDNQLIITVRDKPVPLFYLQDWLVAGDEQKSSYELGHVVIVSVGTQQLGFVVDGLIGQEEVVIKALGGLLQGTAGMAGATITGDGKIAMILDLPSLIEEYA